MVAGTLGKWKRLLLAADAALAVAVVVSVAALGLWPLAVGAEPARPSNDRTVLLAADRNLPGPIGDYAVIYRRDLRKPLYDLKPTPRVKNPPNRPKLTVRLMGTVSEPGFAYGLFRTKSGRDELVAVGQTVDGAQVVAIANGSATLKFHGELITLTSQKKKEARR